MSYGKRLAAETETEETAKYPQEKDKMKKTNDVQIEINRKREGRDENSKDKSTSATQERKEDSTQGEYAYFRLARSAGGV